MKVAYSLKRLAFIVALGCAAHLQSLSAAEKHVTQTIHENRYHTAFPLQKGGEKLDLLVRVGKTKRAHGFYLIFVEPQSWSWEQKDELYRIYQGWVGKDKGSVPYPIKIRLQIDSVDALKDVHIDQVVTERSPRFGRSANNGTVTWRSQILYFGGLYPGVYRVRLENLAPVPQINFETLFFFERDDRKY